MLNMSGDIFYIYTSIYIRKITFKILPVSTQQLSETHSHFTVQQRVYWSYSITTRYIISAPKAIMIMRLYNLTNVFKLLICAMYIVSYNLNAYYYMYLVSYSVNIFRHVSEISVSHASRVSASGSVVWCIPEFTSQRNQTWKRERWINPEHKGKLDRVNVEQIL
jgi:hypothetical protein